jgi:hypothetical protein
MIAFIVVSLLFFYSPARADYAAAAFTREVAMLQAPSRDIATREATARALQAWAAGEGRLPDLIALVPGLDQEIAPPLTAFELETMREALWKRELDYIYDEFQRGRPVNKIWEPDIGMQMALGHLLDGGKLRTGDITALRGALQTARQPNTNALRLKWEKLMDCVGTRIEPHCIFAGF